jgi:hypothetical protein
MSNTYTPSSTWTATIEVPATTDPVTGGVGGAANVGNEDNADRAQWLYSQRFEDFKDRIENESGGHLTAREDDLGHWDVFYVLLPFRPDGISRHAAWDAGNIHRAFYKNTVLQNRILVSLFPAYETTIGGTATLIQANNLTPSVDTMANFRSRVANKGTDYHIMTCYEYGALCLEGLSAQAPMHGNTSSGSYHNYTVNAQEWGKPISAASPTYTYPGTGPLAWRHNLTPWGVCDLIGNYQEFMEGIKGVGTQLVMMGTDNYYDLAETSWNNTGVFYDNDGSGNIVLDTGGPVSLSLVDDFQDITLTAALLAAGNAYAGSVLVDAMIAPEFENSGAISTPTILAAADGQVTITIATGTEENYFVFGGDYNDSGNAGSGARADLLTSSGTASCRYVLVE